MWKPKMGGKKVLRVFLQGDDDLSDSLLGGPEERGAGAHPFQDLVQDKYHGAFTIELTHEPCTRSDFLATPLHSRLFEGSSDVVALSVRPEVALSAGPLKENLARLIRTVKERLDAHVLICNVSTVDPDDQVHNYHGRGDTWALRAHKFNLALMELSVLEGISLIDVERLVAEHGGYRHVLHAGRYSREVHEAIRREFLRVLEDIGFFEDRPLVMQVGRGKVPCSRSC
jgi:hypothetical protein